MSGRNHRCQTILEQAYTRHSIQICQDTCKRTLYPAKPKVREAAYNMLVRPKLEYGSIAWSPHTQNNIDTLEKIHRSAARFVVHDHRRTTSVTHMQGKLGWQTLETRRLQHQLVFLYKIKCNLLNISLPATSHCPVHPNSKQ